MIYGFDMDELFVCILLTLSTFYFRFGFIRMMFVNIANRLLNIWHPYMEVIGKANRRHNTNKQTNKI